MSSDFINPYITNVQTKFIENNYRFDSQYQILNPNYNYFQFISIIFTDCQSVICDFKANDLSSGGIFRNCCSGVRAAARLSNIQGPGQTNVVSGSLLPCFSRICMLQIYHWCSCDVFFQTHLTGELCTPTCFFLAVKPSRSVKIALFFINLVRTLWMDGLTKSEPALSRACCAGPDLYRPIGKFQVIGRI